jgi:hypothetical protein
LSSSATQEKNLDVGFSWVAGDNNKLPGLSSSFSFFSSLVEDNDELGSWLVVVLDCFFKVAKDNDEPPSLLMPFSVFVLNCWKTMTSQEGSLSSFGFIP